MLSSDWDATLGPDWCSTQSRVTLGQARRPPEEGGHRLAKAPASEEGQSLPELSGFLEFILRLFPEFYIIFSGPTPNTLQSLSQTSEQRKEHLLHILGPLGWVTKGHEHTVGQDSAHDDHAEDCREELRALPNLPGPFIPRLTRSESTG